MCMACFVYADEVSENESSTKVKSDDAAQQHREYDSPENAGERRGMISLDSFLRELSSSATDSEKAPSVAIAGHVRPDGDCVGSCLAVYNYIRDNYPAIRVDIYLEPIPEKFSFLKNADQIRSAKNAELVSYDLFIALDCGDEGRLGEAARFFKAARRTICIDHHLTNDSFADINEVHPEASSASELVYLTLNPEKITEEIAECLYLGIAHDTGVFQYTCTSPRTMRIAGDLMGRGIPYSRIVDETYYVRSFAQQKIWGKAFLDSQLYLDGRCIYSLVTREDMEAFHVTPADLDGIVSQLRSTSGVEVSIFLYQAADGYKISLRSASYVDVAKIAAEFGGGGHARAAGASAKKQPEEILTILLDKIAAQL
ncbi:MAG: DHH family phosphoesterase [Clostridiales bacterium]|nr:DHH family phosphoesterase [Clostridiales bacterium]